ncbi:hypothetical protein LTS07_009259 [Exophiala sideris]|nr:hypothetical protein LTS07_009259 [Exophiala sideris]
MDPNLFTGKTYIVTGGAAGIGLGIVRQLSNYGATVYSLDMVKTPISDSEIISHPNVHYLIVDVRDDQACSAAVQQIISSTHNGAIDGLVNNAGICPAEGELPDHELYRRVIDTNFGGAFNMGLAVLPVMRRHGNGGAVVNVGSATDTAMARGPLRAVQGPKFGMDKTDDELLECVAQLIPMKRFGTPDDVANAVNFLLSDLASYITGQVITVAGGSS